MRLNCFHAPWREARLRYSNCFGLLRIASDLKQSQWLDLIRFESLSRGLPQGMPGPVAGQEPHLRGPETPSQSMHSLHPKLRPIL